MILIPHNLISTTSLPLAATTFHTFHSVPIDFSFQQSVMQSAAAPPVAVVDWTPLILSLLAGLSTSLGASVAFCTSKERQLSDGVLSFSLALAGSVMITVSVVSLLPESFLDQSNHELLSIQSVAFWERVGGLVSGCVVYFLLNKAFPEPDAILGFDELDNKGDEEIVSETRTLLLRSAISSNDSQQHKQTSSLSRQGSRISHPREDNIRIRSSKDNSQETESIITIPLEVPPDDKKTIGFWKRFSQGQDLSNTEARRSWRLAMLLFVSLVVHNFPEGVAVGATAMHSPKLGLTTAIAIALHNIPEGIAIAVPCMAARPDSPWLAFGLASASGIAEPLGAAFAMFFLSQSNGEIISMGVVLAFVAGVMIMVAIMELFPEALRHAKDGNKLPMFWGVVSGAVVMIGSDAYIDASS
jgi:ZIP family zinc transporter